MTDENTAAAPDENVLAKRKAYSAATTRLRNENPDLWNVVLQDEYRKAGIDWTPKPTKAEKAKTEIENLLAQFPELRNWVRS